MNINKGIILAIIATLFFSTSPIFTRLATELSPSQVAFARMFGGSLFIAIFLKSGTKLLISESFKLRYLIYGVITAFHFLFYIWSLYYTSIAHSLVIIHTAPVYVYLYEVYKGHKPTMSEAIGTILALLGLGILLGFQPYVDSTIILGNVMAFVSALCLAIYSLIGRREKNRGPLLPYTFWLYFISSLVLLPAAAADFQVAFSFKEISALIGLALFPTALGHTIYNASLRQIRSFYPSIIATQEVTGGILLGIVFLSEIPTIQTIIGALISLAGIIVIVYKSQSS
ncbi:DMT family transporter [Natranaerobius thermophilus]|uniref:EamA domain-containing protein n=1 Tax=Natranaerobius thermophilus (strain ATCC BAA-1301 / DSM 18059 / JW/NM-WN-LF) TaxID=457570 RepID=B2A248_NATTJ|nr:DMT family transporter [Natranaerobius thermophilus]ACB84853.1 protein of unknown function DUF6 transmembrane [Natranaerobius thermophilus JW/NM-WN-LF]